MEPRLQSALGFFVLLGLCWLSGQRRRFSWRVVGGGIGLQLLLGVLLLRLPQSRELFFLINQGMTTLEEATRAGTSMVFGYLGGAEPPFPVEKPDALYILAFRALPLVLVMSALSALLFHWRVLPAIVRGASWLLSRSLGVGGPLGVGTAANVFVGMVEAPLLIRPYLLSLHRGELFAVMVCGMATVAGTMLALYASILGQVVPNAAGHVLTASLISAPAALTVAALQRPWPAGGSPLPDLESDSGSAMDAVTRGASQGMTLLLNIIGVLIVLVALVHLANALLSLLPAVQGEPLTLQRMMGWAFAPLAWLTGVPPSDMGTAGQLLGTKVVLNELIAYLDLAAMESGSLSERSRLLLGYALCGFANFGSLGILLGGLTAMVPERKEEIVELGMHSVWAGFLTSLLTAAVVGMIA